MGSRAAGWTEPLAGHGDLQRPPATETAIRAAVVGTGYGCRTIVPTLRQIAGVKVAVLCGGEDRSKTRRLAERFSIDVWDQPFEEAIATPGLDLVFIAAPHEHHGAMVERALDADLHVVCEKPMALDGSEIARLAERSRRSSKLTLIDHQLRFLPTFRAIGDTLRGGRIGRPYYARVEFFTPRLVEPGVTWRWWFDPDKGGGMLVAMGSHLVDLMQYWFGDEVADVVAHLDPILESVPTPAGGARPLMTESFVHGRLRFATGVICDLLCTGVSRRETSLRISILGTEGEIEFQSPDEVSVYQRSSSGPVREPPSRDGSRQPGSSVFDRAFRRFAEQLVASIRLGDTGTFAGEATSFTDYQYQFRVLQAMRESFLLRTLVEP